MGTLLQEMHHLSHAAQEAQASRSQVTGIGIGADTAIFRLVLPAARAFRRNASHRLAVYQIDNQKQNRQFLVFSCCVFEPPLLPCRQEVC